MNTRIVPSGKTSAANVGRPLGATRTFGDDDFTVDYRDSKEFKSYLKRVDAVLDCAKKPLCFSEIRSQIPGEWPRHWIADALDLIAGVREVGVQPTKYIKETRRIMPVRPFRKFNNGIGQPTDKREIFDSQVTNGRRITA